MTILRHTALRLLPLFVFFLIAEAGVRAALALYDPSLIAGDTHFLPEAFARGFLYDLAVFFYLAVPFMLYDLALPQKYHGTKRDRRIFAGFFFVVAFIVLFSAAGEWFFWDEFQTRYNFIAVDYLVYTTEVIGNIRESYPEGWVLSGVAAIAAACAFLAYKLPPKLWPSPLPVTRRSLALLLSILLAFISYKVYDRDDAQISENRYVNELARNGIYEFFAAFQHNELNYANFYITKPEKDLRGFIAAKTGGKADAASPLLHTVTNPPAKKKYNLVLITVESLSGDYLKHFGGTFGITPNLDALIDKSLFFDRMYATGTRTVYGLAALTLGMPPVPGNSIVRREGNGNLFTLGGVLRDKGYATKFIYGGFGYFDNMNAFFAANGYQVVDRSNMKKEDINFANVWGVSDEDLYNKIIKENDAEHAAGKPFFDMVMTTSNHRPYTYPDGRIDIPSGKGRRGGVKYTDYTIDKFLKDASAKPWFKDTIFVIIADHTAGSSGRSELDPDKYHIPMWVYAPGIVKPGIVSQMASQIDVPPTILGLMGVSYESKFYGRDLMREKPGRVFISNYQQLGLMKEDDRLIVLRPVDAADFYVKDGTDEFDQQKHVPPELIDEAVGYYQSAAQWQHWSREK